jgi:hypothetical protein
MFNNCADFNIQAGSLYNVAGNVYLQNQQHLTIQGHAPPKGGLPLRAGSTTVLEDGWDEAAGPELSGMVRNVRHARSPSDGELKLNLEFSRLISQI